MFDHRQELLKFADELSLADLTIVLKARLQDEVMTLRLGTTVVR